MTSDPGEAPCHSCKAVLTSFSRGDSCEKCRRDTRVCLNCVHFDAQSYNECRENQADRVVEKDRSNFCDYFRPGMNARNGTPGEDPAAKARAAAEALFKNLGKK